MVIREAGTGSSKPKKTTAPSAANLAEAEQNIVPPTTKTITPSQNANTYSASTGNSGSNGMQAVKLPAPKDQTPLIDEIYSAEREANLNALEAEYNAAIGEIEREKAAIAPAYQNARNQAAGVNARETQAMNEKFNAAGLSSGGRAQGAIAQSNTLQGELSALELAEAQALAEIESQRTQLATQYQGRVREAIMNNEMDKAAALYEEAIRFDEAMIQHALEQAQLDMQVASMRKTSSGGGARVQADDTPSLSLGDAKAQAEKGYFSDAGLDAFHANGWDDGAISAVYGYAPGTVATPAPTPVAPTNANEWRDLYNNALQKANSGDVDGVFDLVEQNAGWLSKSQRNNLYRVAGVDPKDLT